MTCQSPQRMRYGGFNFREIYYKTQRSVGELEAVVRELSCSKQKHEFGA